MKVLAFLNAYSNGKSGGDMCFVEIFKRLPSIKLTVVTSKLGKKLCTSNNVKAKYVLTTRESKFRFIIWIYFWRIVKGIVLSVTKTDITVIYITSDSLPDVLPALVSKIRNPRAKVIGKIFHIIPSTRILSSIAQEISHFLLKKFANSIVVDNSIVKDELIAAGFLSSKIFVNYPAINSAYLKKIKPLEKYTATFMGRIHSSKGVFELIDIWKEIVEQIPDATLGIIGKGNSKITNQLQEKINQYELSKNISLLGFVPNEKAYTLIKGSNVFLFPSHEEGFGMVIGEVLALGVPIVTYDLPIYKETFKTVITTTVERFQTDDFAKHVMDILLQHKKYDKVRAAGLKLVTKYSWDDAAKKELEIINL